jgi:hypothetical protein
MGFRVGAQLPKVRRRFMDESLEAADFLSEHLHLFGETGPLAGEGETGLVLAENWW